MNNLFQRYPKEVLWLCLAIYPRIPLKNRSEVHWSSSVFFFFRKPSLNFLDFFSKNSTRNTSLQKIHKVSFGNSTRNSSKILHRFFKWKSIDLYKKFYRDSFEKSIRNSPGGFSDFFYKTYSEIFYGISFVPNCFKQFSKFIPNFFQGFTLQILSRILFSEVSLEIHLQIFSKISRRLSMETLQRFLLKTIWESFGNFSRCSFGQSSISCFRKSQIGFFQKFPKDFFFQKILDALL